MRHANALMVAITAWLALLAAPPAIAGGKTVVRAGNLEAHMQRNPWHLTFTGGGGRTVLGQHPGTSAGPNGALGFRTAGLWRRATRVISAHREGRAWVARLATTDPTRSIDVRIAPDEEGAIAVEARLRGPAAGVNRMGIAFGAREQERYLGFGERSNAVDQRGHTVESYVGEGPYIDIEYAMIAPFVPLWGFHTSNDATYFPMPWLLSTAGYGVLIDNTQRSLFRLATESPGAWSVEVDGRYLRFRVIAGPEPRDVLRRMTRRVGRQPEPAAPWFLGAWWQPTESSGEEERQEARLLRERDVPVSVNQQSLHYLPCGDQVGRRLEERGRTRFMHRRGMAMTAYFNPMICANYSPFDEARRRGLLTESPLGGPSLYLYQDFPVGQVDFSHPEADEFYGSLLSEAVADGYDGWMEDFGEYTPPHSQSHNGMGGSAMHNLYPVLFHCAGWRFARNAERPLARFIRSGYTGVHRCAQLVWGGDPSSTWGFDGLASAVRNGLTMGLSGISLWGSDIGGFFELTTELSPELLKRWVQFGAVSGFMENRARGIDGLPGGPRIPSGPRPQVTDPGQIEHFRRYAKIRTQLYPYLVAAGAKYRRSGLPIMRHLALVYPEEHQATARDDEFLFGPNLLAAPVLEPGARERRLYLPKGLWVDFWRSVAYRKRGGALRMRGARTLHGGRERTIPAPLDELPLLARAGTLLPLLPPEVDTLARYGKREALVKLSERRDELVLIAFPRGTSSARFYERGRLRSRERRHGWVLSIRGKRRRTYRLQAALGTLRRELDPCRVTLDGRELPKGKWRYNGVRETLFVSFRARSARLAVLERC